MNSEAAGPPISNGDFSSALAPLSQDRFGSPILQGPPADSNWLRREETKGTFLKTVDRTDSSDCFNQDLVLHLLQVRPNPSLERKISARFEAIADIGWFPEDVETNSGQLNVLKQVLGDVSGKRILDAGCARGRFIKRLLPLGAKMYGVDLTDSFLNAASANIPQAVFTRGSLSALPFRSESFDAVYAIEVIEHLPDTELAIREMSRILKPNGTLLVIDKSLIGFYPYNGLPNLIAKPLAERLGKWMYPPDFEFQERWFWPWRMASLIRRYCDQVQTRFVPEGRGKASYLYRLLPFLSIDVAWIGTKAPSCDTRFPSRFSIADNV